jgi:hypothetical protein
VSRPPLSTRIFLTVMMVAMCAVAGSGVLLLLWMICATVDEQAAASRRKAFDAGNCWVSALGGAIECPDGGRP